MNALCLSCQAAGPKEKFQDRYHPGCARKLFGTAKPPKIPFGTPEIAIEAGKMVGKMSVSGVQPKLSLCHDPKKHLLVIAETGGNYILKPQTELFPFLPENENLCMNIAVVFGMQVPPHGLLPLEDGRLAYIVKRFDRLDDGTKCLQEDFQQLLQKKDKYEGSFEQIGNLIKKHSDVPGLDLTRLYGMALLFFVLGNGDAHLKNFSMIRTEDVGYHLSPAYDIVNSRVVLPDEREELCLSIQGKKNRIGKKEFIALAGRFGLNAKQTDHMFDRLAGLQPDVENMVKQSLLPNDLKEGFLEIFWQRMKRVIGK